MSLDSYFHLASVNITTVTGAAFCIFVTSLLSYVIYAFSIREKSFEEVIEEQRKREQEEQQQKAEKLKKEKEKDKKYKKWAKKAKERNDQVMEAVKDEAIQEGQNVMELNNDIEIVEPIKKKNKISAKQNNLGAQLPAKVASTIEKPVKAVSEPPPLHQEEKRPSKEEKSLAKEESTAKKETLVKDEKKSKLDSKERERKQEISKDVGLQNPQATQTEPVQQESVVQISPVITNKKKKRVDHEKEDHIPMTANKLISLIKETPLEENDNQMLINTILNKQKEASEWKKTGDNQNVKKQKDMSSSQDQRQKQSMKVQDAGSMAKASSSERNMNSKLEAQQTEIQSLTTRIKQIEEALLHEKKVTEEKTNELEKTKLENAANVSAIKKLEDEKSQLKKTLKHLQSESKTSDADTIVELEKIKKSKDDLQKVHTLLVEQHTQIHATHNSETKRLTSQIMEMNKILEKTQSENETLSNEMNGWQNKLESVETAKVNIEKELKVLKQSSKKEMNHLNALLEESKKRTQDLDKQLKEITEKFEELTRKNNQLSTDLATVQNENERLSAELAASNERVSGDGQEMLQQNGEINGKVTEDQSIIVEKEKDLLEKEGTIQQLRKEMENLNKEIEIQKQKNNELREKNWKTMEALTEAEKITEQKAKEAERVAREKLEEVEKKLQFTVQEAETVAKEKVRELEEQLKIASTNSADADRVKELSERLCQTEGKLTALQEECNSYQKKYECTVNDKNNLNAEIQKLRNAEVSLLDQIKNHETLINKLNSDVLDSETNSKECLQRLFPSAQLQASLPFNEWLVQLETQIKGEFQKVIDAEKHIEELQVQLTEITKLRDDKEKDLNNHIKILSETESLLRGLSESAKATEAEYSEKLKVKEQQLEKALNELAAVEKLKEELSLNIKELDQLREEHLALQSSFSSSQDKVTDLERKYEEVNNNFLNLQGQIESKDQQIAKLQEEIGSVDKLRKETDDLRSKLEKEKEINKNFNTQMVKLNSLVKIGQDALQQEQETVKKLQSQLTEKQATTNGTSSPPAIPELSVKTSEKPKKSKRSDASGKK